MLLEGFMWFVTCLVCVVGMAAFITLIGILGGETPSQLWKDFLS